MRIPHLIPVLVNLPLVEISTGLPNPKGPHDVLHPQRVSHNLPPFQPPARQQARRRAVSGVTDQPEEENREGAGGLSQAVQDVYLINNVLQCA